MIASTYEYTAYFPTKSAYKELKGHLRDKLEISQCLDNENLGPRHSSPRKYRAHIYSRHSKELLISTCTFDITDDIDEGRMVWP